MEKKKQTSSQITGSGERNYVQIATEYAKAAVADKGRKRFGKWVRLAAKRFLDDLKRAKKKACPFYFDEWHAIDACDFIEKLPHVEGEWDTENVVLHPSHVLFVVQLFGFRNQDGTRRFTTALFAVARKNAKALALDTPIPTPSGWLTMGDIKPGDKVFGVDGKPCNVIATSDIFVDHKCYRVEFSNGESIIADAGHLWETYAQVDQVNSNRVGNRQTRHRVRTTEEIANSVRYGKRGDVNHSIMMPDPICADDADLPISPYALGAWLGDGNSGSGNITNAFADEQIIDEIRAEGWPVRLRSTNNAATAGLYSISNGDRGIARFDSFQAKLRKIGLINNKYIPDIYLRASKEQRLALLQGLMDTDGTISKNGRVISFTNTNKRLVENFSELLATFGIKHTTIQNKLVCNGVNVEGIGYKVQFMAFSDEIPVFKLDRKLKRMRKRSECVISPRSRRVQITKCEAVDSVPTKCITVNSKDSLFLCGKTMIPTHNSFLCSAVLLYCFCCEKENGPQVVSAATTGQQARIIFNVAKRMVERLPDLREAFTLEAFANAIARYEVGGTFKPINAKASTQDGLNPSHTGIDEIHAHKNHDLLNVLKSAAGARKNPLFLYTTTEGYESPGPWAEIRHFAKQLLEGVIEADHFLVLYYALDDENPSEGIKSDDDFDEAKWIKANPLMEVNPLLLKEIRKEAIEAKQMPGRHAEFKIKRLNRPSSAAGGWVNLVKWKACNGNVDLEWLKQYPCYGGLDLASTRDLTSFRLVWDVEGVIYTHGWRFVPTAAVRYRTERGLVPYQAWVTSGKLIESGHEVTDYDAVEQVILDAKRDFNIQMIGYDLWNAQQLAQKLTDADVPMQEFIQGTKSFHPAMKALEVAYVSGNFCHGNDPILNWNASNLIARTDQNMNTAPDKKKSADKIDDMVALLMAVGTYLSAPVAEKSFWESA